MWVRLGGGFSIFPAPEKLYPLHFFITPQALVGRPIIPLDTPHEIILVIVEIVSRGQCVHMQNFVGVGCLYSQTSLIPLYTVPSGTSQMCVAFLTKHEKEKYVS